MGTTKEIITSNDYIFKVLYNTKTETVIFYIPIRKQEPISNGYEIEYSISNNGILYKLNDTTEEINCPDYARRTLIFSDIRIICDYLKFNSQLLEFWVDDDRIDSLAFLNALWSSSYKLDKINDKKEREFLNLINRAINAIIPFHESFYFEAKYLDVVFGYRLIKFIFDNRGK